jgi:homoserine kinase type II
MGVKSPIELKRAQALFYNFHLMQLIPTKDGTVDTTYIAKAKNNKSYILKKYERASKEHIIQDAYRLDMLSKHGLLVPKLLASNKEYYLYTKLPGTTPTNITYHHISALGRFLAQFHTITKKETATKPFMENYNIKKMLHKIKSKHYLYYKKCSSLLHYQQPYDGFIHGDIFRDNTLFYNNKVAVIDFIDGGYGMFCFDAAVVLLDFNPKNKPSFQKLFLRCYNQHAPKKISQKALIRERSNAKKLYGLLRIDASGKTKRSRAFVCNI